MIQFHETLRLKPDFSPAKVYLAHAREGSLTP